MSANQPREIAFEDIKVGDDITASRAENGVTRSYRGVVGVIGKCGTLFTAEGGYIGCSDTYMLTLNHRPALAEPMGLGAVVRATTCDGKKGVFVRTHPGVYGHVWRGLANGWNWAAFAPDSIEVLSEGIEVES